jgi:hypothetical protein
MPLMTLQSDLSWYGSNSGFQAPQSKQDTRFNYDPGDLTVAVAPRGFDNAGFQSNAFIPRVSSNTFNIDGQGTATRLTQLGTGTKFPIGPEGQIHDFDTKRTGFNAMNRYGDTFNNKVLKGLAATYTAASPIDDMYNKFKVRDEVYDPYGYAKPPFILKGIQKDGSSDPERWGTGTPGLNIPRGGITANAERTAADIERIGKFLIRPEGIAFIAKQNILRQMIPNLESTLNNGILPGGAIGKLNTQKIYSPLNTLATVMGLSYGLRFKNYGLLPIDDGISKYEDVVVRNRVTEGMKYRHNRLHILNQERQSVVASLSPYWIATSNLSGGPDSIGGLGPSLASKSPSSKTVNSLEQLLDPQYSYGTPYLFTRDNFNPYSNETIQATIDGRGSLSITPAYSQRAYYNLFDIINTINGRKKNSLFQIANDITKYTFLIKPGTTLPLTGLQAQLDFHSGTINKFGDGSALRKKIKTYDTPYIGERKDDIVNANITNIEDEGKLLNSLRSKVTDSSFTAIPQREVNKAASNTKRATDISSYTTLAYGNIPKERLGKGKKELIDFSTGKAWDVGSKPTLESKYGYVSYNGTSKPDPIMNDSGASDLINFSFTPSDGGSDSGGPIKFRAYIISLNDSFNPSWDEQQDQGRADPKIRYQSFGREISISFKVVVHSAAERGKVWQKLGNLAKLTFPVYSGAGFGGKYVRVTVGDLYKNTPMYVTNVSYSWDSETPWEIQKGHQLPLYTDVDISLGWIGQKRPNYNSAKIYG